MIEKQYVPFSDLPVSAEFSLNGNRWTKRSTRTAEISKPVEHKGVWFYFSSRTLVVVERQTRITF